MDQQPTLDFNAGAARKYVEHIQTKTPAAKLVLFALATHEARHTGRLPTIDELAKASKRSRRAVQYGLRELEAIEIVQHLRINWNKVDDYRPAAGGAMKKAGGATSDCTRAIAPVQREGCNHLTLGGSGGLSLVPAQLTKAHLYHEMGNDDETHEFSKDKRTDEAEATPSDPVEAAGRRWLNQQITKQDLHNGHTVRLFWHYAVRRGWVTDESELTRLWFFATARFCAREAKRSAGSYFTRSVKKNWRNARTNADDDAAKKVIDHVFHQVKPRTPEAYVDVEAQDAADRETRRREQMKLLAERSAAK